MSSPSMSSGGVAASMWATPAGAPERKPQGSDTGPASRGGRGGSKPRGGRGGGQRSRAPRGNQARGAKDTNDSNKPTPASAKGAEKPPSTSTNIHAPPSPVASTTSVRTGVSDKSSGRPRGNHRGTEQRQSRKPTLNVDSAAASNVSNSPNLSPRASRRKRSNASNQANNATAPSAISRQSSISVDSGLNRLQPEKHSISSAPAKDIPPHLQPPPHTADAPSFDIRHDIDALVERVRAVAMDRPHTPGSHIDWAGEDDDSLPDLDDWGITSSTTDPTTDSGKASFISPILEDALKPLPGIGELDVPTPSITVSEVKVAEEAPTVTKDASEETPKTEPQTSVKDSMHVPRGHSRNNPKAHSTLPSKPASIFNRSNRRHPLADSSIPSKATNDAESQPTSGPGPASKLSLEERLSSPPKIPAELDLSVPDHLTAPTHHIPSSRSAPAHLDSHPHRGGRGGFNPAHGRAHTMGRFIPNEGDRPRRGGPAHARNHSTPSSAGDNSSGRAHASRPVITGDAISRLARTLGATGLAKRGREAGGTTATAEA